MALGGGGGGNAGGIRAGRAYVELGANDKLSGQLKAIGGKFVEFGKLALSATGIGGLLAGLSFKGTADDLNSMRDAIKAMGMSATGGSGLFGVLGQFSDLNENVEGLTQFSDAIQQALKDGGKTTALFEGLSISAKDLEGVPLDEQFYRIHDAIRRLPQDQQAYKLGLVGGTDSMKKWLPLLSMSNEELRAQAKALAFGNDELEDAARASKAMTQAQGQLNRVWQQGVIAFAPMVADAAKGLTDAMRPVVEWSKGRTLGMIGDEIAARFNLAWEEVKLGGQELWIDVGASAKIGVLELGETVNTVLTKDFWYGLGIGFAAEMNAVGTMFDTAITNMVRDGVLKLSELGRALANPMEAGKIGLGLLAAPVAAPVLAVAEIGKALAGADAEVQKYMKQFVLDLASGKYGALTKGGILAEAEAAKISAAAGRNVARDNLAATLARIEAERNMRRGDNLMGTPLTLGAQKLAAAGRSLGTFGSGSFLTQGYARQSASDPVKQMVAEQKKGNVTLGEIKNAVINSVPKFL